MTYSRNAWYVGSWSHKLESGKPLGIHILNEPIVLYRTESGKAVALEDRCPHRMAPLSMGRCEGESLRCMYHGFRFEPDGKCSEIPGQDIIPSKSQVRSYPVLERHGWVWVWMGDTSMVDEGLIPPIIGPDDGEYVLGKGELDYKAEAHLIWDNLLDFSHLAYVHANSFNATETWGEMHPTITPLSRGVRVERWMLNQPPLFGDESTDQWFAYDFLVPGILTMKTLTYPIGKAEQFGFMAPPETEQWVQNSYTAHAITPMTDNTSRYFFTFGPHNKGSSAEAGQQFLQIAYAAFAEDKAFIEAQSKVISETPDRNIIPSKKDVGITMFHRINNKIVGMERD